MGVRGGAYLLRIRVAALEKLVGEKIGTGHADVFDVQAEIRGVGVCEGGFSVASQYPAGAGGGEEGDCAVAGAQVFIDLPCLCPLFEGAQKRVTFDVDVFRGKEA